MALGTTISNEVFLWILLVIFNYMFIMNYGKAKGHRRLLGASFMTIIMPISFLVVDTTLTFDAIGDINVLGLAFTTMGAIYFFIQLRIYLKDMFNI